VIGQHDPGVDVKWSPLPCHPHRLTQGFDLVDQQVRSAIVQTDGEKVSGSRNTVSAIIWHCATIPEIEASQNKP